jgi:hypothetical protein
MYSKKQLKAIMDAPEFNEATQKVVNSLVTAMNEGKKLSLAEEEFLGIVVHSSVDENGQHPNMHDYKALHNDLFRRLYPAYVRNRYGLLYQEDAYGEVPPERKKQDVDFLDEKYQEWDKLIRSDKHNSESLQYLVSEVKSHLQSADTFARQAHYGSRLRDAVRKEIVLHSKYLLYYVDEY